MQLIMCEKIFDSIKVGLQYDNDLMIMFLD